MTLVVGATGMVGTEICRLLAAKEHPVAGLVRSTADAAKVAKLQQLGVEIRRGDLRDPASLAAACRDVTSIISTASAMPFAYDPAKNTPQTTDEQGITNLIEAAQTTGVRQFVYVSFPPMSIEFPLQTAKRAVERKLQASGLTYTILRPTYFTEVWLSPAVGFDHVNAKASIYGTGDNRISWISYRDVAQFAVASVDNPEVANAIVELGGPDAMSPHAVVQLFESISGRKFDVTHVPVEGLRGQHAVAADPMQRSFAALMVGYATAAPIDMAATLTKLPVRLRSVEAYARSVMQRSETAETSG